MELRHSCSFFFIFVRISLATDTSEFMVYDENVRLFAVLVAERQFSVGIAMASLMAVWACLNVQFFA